MARATDWARAVVPPIRRWLPRGALAAALGAVAILGGLYLRALFPVRFRDEAPAVKQPAAERRAVGGDSKRPTSGDLRVSSTPTGARVLVDGKPRGVTPVVVTGLSAGLHTVELESAQGTVRRSVTIAAGETAALSESIFPGWLAVYAPFELSITEGERSLHLDDRNQIMLPPGPHQLRLTNQALDYEAMREVELKPGEITRLSITPPRSALSVTANESAEVWLDGARVGETPLTALPVDLGTHEVVLKRAAGGERRFTVRVTAKPSTLDVDFTKPEGD